MWSYVSRVMKEVQGAGRGCQVSLWSFSGSSGRGKLKARHTGSEQGGGNEGGDSG